MSLKPVESRIPAILAFTMAESPRLGRRLATLRRDQPSSSAFLPEGNASVAAGLMRRVLNFAAVGHESGGGGVVQKMPVSVLENLREPYRKVTVSINLRRPMQALADVLHPVETGSAYLFIEEFPAYRNPFAGSAPIEGQLAVSGHMSQMGLVKQPS